MIVEAIERQIRNFIGEQGYQLLSSYVNCKTKLLLKCCNGHEYKATWEKFKQGCRCPYCARVKVTYQQVKQFIEEQGYKLLSKQYVNCKTKLLLQCPNRHKYMVTWNNFHSRGVRCNVCAGQIVTYEQVKDFLEQRKYKLLSKDYTNAHVKLLVQCDKNHRYDASWGNLKQGYGCPKCKESKGERQLYEILKQIFPNYKITSQDDLGFLYYKKPLKVDFAIRDLKLVFEYDGGQHFRPVEHWGGEKTFKETQKRDQKKNDLCKINGYQIIRFRYDERLTKQKVLQKYIKENYNG